MKRRAFQFIALSAVLLCIIILSSASYYWSVAAKTANPSAQAQASLALMGDSRLLWMLGSPDDSFVEFANYDAGIRRYSASAAPANGANWKKVPKGLNKSVNPDFSIDYSLDTVPEYGVQLQVKVLGAYKSVPQMAVFSNGMLSGIVQIAGVGGTTSKYAYKKTYDLYIPKEMLRQGDNELKLEAIGCMYCSPAENQYLWWNWDYIALTALPAPAEEPIHGNYIASGTSVNNMSFYYDEGAVRHLPYVLKWLGIAYSGNIMRTGCATDVKNACSSIKEYYETLRDYNTQAVSFHLHTGNIKLKADGTLPDDAEAKLADYLKNYGSLFQYYEVDNEPGLFNRSKAVNLAIAKWLGEHIPILAPHMKTVAPGWAYAPEYEEKACKNQAPGQTARCGDPDGWESDPAQRKELERVTDLTNGHAYGSSYVDNDGGSFVENLETFGGAEDGLPKMMLNTEYGTSDSHTDDKQYGAVQPKAAAFDRIMRAHIGYADMFTQHAAFYPSYSLFETGFDLNGHNPSETRIHSNPPEQDSRAAVMRRLNLAYATHGRPLAYEVTNKSGLTGKLVYVRAVDTSSLKPLPGSQGTSDKILLNFVNFEKTAQTIEVKVTMPEAAEFEGERFGAGDTYEEARTYVSGLQAAPELQLKETLAPGEAVQYILTRSAKVKPKASAWLDAAPLQQHAIELDWQESEGARGYDVWRSSVPGGSYTMIAENIQKTHYFDNDTQPETAYSYQIQVTGTKRGSPVTQATATDYASLDRKDWAVSSSSGKPERAIDDNPNSRWDTGTAQTEGQYYQVDMKKTAEINRIVLRTEGSPNDFSKGYEVYLSDDGSAWGSPAATGRGATVTDIRFAPRRARYVKIVQTARSGSYWSIHELYVYGIGEGPGTPG